MVWETTLDAIRQDAWIISIAIGVGLSLFIFVLNRRNVNKRRDQFKKIIRANVLELTEIFDKINHHARKVEEDDYEAEFVRSYFDRRLYRMELLRMNVETHLAQINLEDEFFEKIKGILSAEAWLVETYHEQGASNARRLSVWKTGYGELESRMRKAEAAATDLRILEPVVVD